MTELRIRRSDWPILFAVHGSIVAAICGSQRKSAEYSTVGASSVMKMGSCDRAKFSLGLGSFSKRTPLTRTSVFLWLAEYLPRGDPRQRQDNS